MANSVEIGLTEVPDLLAPEVVGGPTLGLTEVEGADGPVPEPDELEHVTSKQVEVKEEVDEASKGQKDGKETSRRGDSLDRVNAALVLSVAAVAIVGAIVAIAKKLRER